jgi:hypothetical protein
MSSGATAKGEQQQKQQQIIDLVDDDSDDEIENEKNDPQQHRSSTEVSVSSGVTRKRKPTQSQGTKTEVDSDVDVIDLVDDVSSCPTSSGVMTTTTIENKSKKMSPQDNVVDDVVDVIDLINGPPTVSAAVSAAAVARKGAKRQKSTSIINNSNNNNNNNNTNDNDNICSNDAAIAAAIAASKENAYSYTAPAKIKTSATSTAKLNLVVELGGNDNDNAILTHGIVENIQQVISSSYLPSRTTTTTTSSTKYYYWTCIPSNSSPSSSSDDNTTNTTGMIPGIVQHIQQNDRWSCGYRNYQMMLSAILPRLASSSNHMIYQRGYITRREIITNTTHKAQQLPIILPSLKQTQKSIEDSWDEGFDPNGANHYRHKIVGKQSNSGKIGAMEVCNLFWYHGIDSVVIQFIKCYKSRQQLPYFIRNYFGYDNDNNSYTNNNNNKNKDACFIANKVLSDAYTESNFGISQQQQQQQQTTKNACTTNNTFLQKTKLPLYLQWEGHSVTIVGIEIQIKVKQNTNMVAASVAATATTAKNNNDNDYDHDFTLLVLDPMKSSPKIKNDLRICKLKQQQQQQHTSSLSSSSSPSSPSSPSSLLPNSVRLEWKDIQNKDMQIILCTLRSMTYQERMKCCDNGGSGRSNNNNNNNNNNMHGRVITAAEDAVQKQINHYGR